MTKTIPYASATAGQRARDEITKILRRLGCESIGWMDDFEKHEVLLAFKHRGRQMQIPASAKGWAAMYLKENPWNHNRRSTRTDYEQAAVRQGHIAVSSVLRDWMKGMVTAIECGIVSVEAVFLPFMLTHDGRTVSERVAEIDLLPQPEQPKVVSLPSR